MQNYNDKIFFKDIKKEGKDYSNEITEAFPFFCLKVFWDNLSKEEIINSLSDLSTNDESIDAFFVDEENREINIIQCKSCMSEKNQKPLKKDSLEYLKNTPIKLSNHEYIDSHRNDRVKEIAKEFASHNSKGFTTKFHFFHLGYLGNPNMKKYCDDIGIDYYDWDRIKEEYQEYLSKLDRTEPPYIDIQLCHEAIEPNISNSHKTIVSIITGDELINLREQYRYKLFDKNLRFGLGKNKINKGIAETASGEPKNFYFYNNGITITSKGFKFKQSNQKLKIEYPQIINGAQTVNAIYDAYKNRLNKYQRRNPATTDTDSKSLVKEEFKEINILFRVIQDAEKDGRKTSEFEGKVIRYNNSQNSIKETDFYANEPEQIKIQQLMAQLGYFYEIKRGDRKFLDNGREKHNLLNLTKSDFDFWNEKIDMEVLASIWMAYQLDPALDAVQKGNIFGYAQNKYYREVFGTIDNVSEQQVKEMILAYNLFIGISSQTQIYGNTKLNGQIVSKVSQINLQDSDSDKAYENIKLLINKSALFNDMIKKDIADKETFFQNKEEILMRIREYQFFSMGRYLILAIMKLIFDKCNYSTVLIQHGLFDNKDFIDDQIVKKWLKIILDNLVGKEHTEFDKNIGSSLKAFYTRNDTWVNIQKKFNNLRYDLDQEYEDIFTLKLT